MIVEITAVMKARQAVRHGKFYGLAYARAQTVIVALAADLREAACDQLVRIDRAQDIVRDAEVERPHDESSCPCSAMSRIGR